MGESNKLCFINTTLLHILLLFINVYGQTNYTTSTTTTLQPDTTFFMTEYHRYDIKIDILVDYSFNSTNTNIDGTNIDENLRNSINKLDLNGEYLINIVLIIKVDTMNIEIVINTNNEIDGDAIIQYAESNAFDKNMQTIIEQSAEDIIISNVEVTNIVYTDNEYIKKLDWLDPLNYTPGQYLIVGGAAVIICCIIVVCGVYCYICNKGKKHSYSSYSIGSAADSPYPRDGPVMHGFNNRSAVQLGDTASCQYVD